MRFFLFATLTLLLLMGCSSSTPSIREYTLLLQPTTQRPNTLIASKSLSIASPKALPSLSGKNILYLRENTETGSYLYSRWHDTPSSFIQRSLLQAIEAEHLFTAVAPTSSLVQSDWILESDLNAFHHRFIGSMSEGYIDITYRLLDPKTKHTIKTKRFIITAPAPTHDAAGGVEALKNALLELNRQSIQWLGTDIKENR